MGVGITAIGGGFLALLLAGYFGQKFLPAPKPKFVGIDLGTTYSCIGVYRAVSGIVEVLPSPEGEFCIPSVVSFTEEGILVGTKALFSYRSSKNTIYDAKRFIGKTFSQEAFDIETKRYPFKCILNANGTVSFAIFHNGQEHFYKPEDIGSLIIAQLKKTAEAHLQNIVKFAVISVPADFDEVQRNHTRFAAELAGFNILRIITEPTAAALAYGLHEKHTIDTVLVFDLGGGTEDVSLLKIQGGMFITQALAGNNHLGGQDFNERLFLYLSDIIKSQYHFSDLNSEDAQALRSAIEYAKINLTTISETIVSFKLSTGTLFSHLLSRNKFEELNDDLFKKMLKPIDAVLKVTDTHRDEIDEVVLVGGSTRLPKVRQLIKDYFNMDPNVSIDPDQAVTHGVAIQAGILGGVWPLKVSAIEIPSNIRKFHLN